MPSLQEIFIHELKDLHSAESQLIAALPKMQKASATPELADAFKTHLAQTKEHKNRLQEIGKLLDEKLTGETCKAMQGLIEEGQGILEDFDESSARDAALIAAAQRVEHYEISAYGSALALAKALGHDEVAAILDETLQEEGDTDKLLTQICEQTVVPAALSNDGAESFDIVDDGETLNASGAASSQAKGSSKQTKGGSASGKSTNKSKNGGDASAAKNSSNQDYESMTKEELYQLAQEQEIAGRSQMDKQELIKALA